MRVLVIEDDPDVTLLYRLALEQAGHTVDAAGLGRDGVVQAAAELPDVVILDGRLPDGDGLEVLLTLRRDPRTESIPVVMVSARVSAEDQRAALDAGAAAYVVKPFTPSRLIEVVAEVAAAEAVEALEKVVAGSTGGPLHVTLEAVEPTPGGPGLAALQAGTEVTVAAGGQSVLSATLAATPADDGGREGDGGSFVHAVSHELRTPLTSILGFSGLLADRFRDVLPADALEMADRIRSSASKLERLLTDLLELDRIGRGTLTAHRERVMVEEVIARCVGRVAVDGRSVHVSVDADLDAFVDAGQLERIVESLMIHAVHTTPVETTIEVSAHRSDEGFILMVEDDGPGVPEAEREQIFEPFTRTAAAAGTGNGIGLSLVARFAALHGGRAWVQDRSGGGASFCVELCC